DQDGKNDLGLVPEGRLKEFPTPMSHSYHTALFHCIFSTKGRSKIIFPALQEPLHPCLAGVAKETRRVFGVLAEACRGI
ncbi:MAG: hypothetical protein M3Y56_02310, partial [Armatimonadota bacterium]|nr:hypothetical protein [Armatimonadota bacterium]